KSGVTGGSRAPGGNVYAGGIYEVGERGRELFSPTTNGTITNNATLNNLLSSGRQASSSVSATFNVSINVNGGMSPGDVENLRGPVLQIIEQAWQQASTGTTSRGSTIL
ncbi:MAG: hypothetical protein ACO39X_07720, partial [Candidatus Nanopelagicaceae bacterium]